MVKMPFFHHRRGQDTLFLQRTWYAIQLPGRPETALSAGNNRDDPITRMVAWGYSSQNWQMFPQDGRYFIRNWDWGSKF